MTKAEERRALEERDWWNEIGELWGVKAFGWSGKHNCSFDDGGKAIDVSSSKVAQSLHDLSMILKGKMSVEEALKRSKVVNT